MIFCILPFCQTHAVYYISEVLIFWLFQVGLKVNSISPSDFYYDMEYCVDYSTFRSFISG